MHNYEISLRIINYFMDRFLGEYIPEIFEADYWDENKYQTTIEYIKLHEEEVYKKYCDRKNI